MCVRVRVCVCVCVCVYTPELGCTDSNDDIAAGTDTDFVVACTPVQTHHVGAQLGLVLAAYRLRYGLSCPRFESRRGQVFIFTSTSSLAVEPTQRPLQWVWGMKGTGT